MKKLFYLALLALMFTPFVGVDARTCQYGFPSPPIYYDGRWTTDVELERFYTSDDSCYAKNMYVYFTDGSWTSTFQFTVEAVLMEKDTTGNAPDQAKKYFGFHSLSSLDFTWSLDNTEIPTGPLDSTGDQGCELYMKFRLTEPFSQSTTEYFAEDMFRYTVCMD